MVAELQQRLREGKITTRSIESQRRSAFRGSKRVRKELTDVAVGIGEVGMGHVDAELARQEH